MKQYRNFIFTPFIGLLWIATPTQAQKKKGLPKPETVSLGVHGCEY